MRRVLFILAISLTPALLPALASPAAAQPAKAGPGTTAVKTANDTIFALIKKKAPAADLTKAVQAFININALGKAAMVNQWSKLKPAEQTEFLKVLNQLIEANYVSVQTGNVAYTTDYVSETTNANGNLVVATEIKTTRKGRPFTIKIDYELTKNGASYQAFDLVIDGASTVTTYREMFDKIMSKGTYADLIKKMNAKLTQIQQSAGGAAGTGGGSGAGTGSATPAKKT